MKTNKYDDSPTNCFTEKLEEHDGATVFFVSEKQQKTILNFSLDLLVITE